MTGPMLKKNSPHVSRMPPWTTVGMRKPVLILIRANESAAAPMMTDTHMSDRVGKKCLMSFTNSRYSTETMSNALKNQNAPARNSSYPPMENNIKKKRWTNCERV